MIIMIIIIISLIRANRESKPALDDMEYCYVSFPRFLSKLSFSALVFI